MFTPVALGNRPVMVAATAYSTWSSTFVQGVEAPKASLLETDYQARGRWVTPTYRLHGSMVLAVGCTDSKVASALPLLLVE